MPDVPCADFHAGKDDTKNWSVHPTKDFASLLRSFEFCLSAVTHNENHVHGLGECLRIVIRQNGRCFNDDDVRQISCSSNNSRRTVYQLSAIRHKLTQRYRRNILDKGRLHPNRKIHRSDVLSGIARLLQ